MLSAKGFCMGIADIVPGVSGGTMALILRIYVQLIEAVRSFDWPWLRAVFRLDIRTVFGRPHFGFLIPLVIGIFVALMFFTRIISLPQLIEFFPEPVYGLFFGLILGSILVLLREFMHAHWQNWVCLLAGAVVGWWIFNMVPSETPDASWFIMLSGALAISAMLLPGISGSFILLILNKYAYIFTAIGQLNLSVLAPFAAGIVLGLVSFSRVISWLLRHFYSRTLAVIIGLLVASLWVIWPFQQRIYTQVGDSAQLLKTTPVWPDAWTALNWLALVLVVCGFFTVIILNSLAQRQEPDKEPA